MDTILDTLVKRQQEQMASDTADAVKDINPLTLIGGEGSSANLWDVKPADPELMAALQPPQQLNSARSRGSRGTRGSRGSSRRSTRSRMGRTGKSASTGRLNSRASSRSSRRTKSRGAGAAPPATPGSKGSRSPPAAPDSDTRSVSSRMTNRSRASAKPAGANDVIFDLQCRTRDYVAKSGVEKLELEDVNVQIRDTMKKIDKYRQNLGGVLALRNNDNNVARQVDIMERRMVKAQNTYMDQIAHNNQLRSEVNVWRREILFLKQANGSIRADITRLMDANRGLEQRMKEEQHQHKQCEDDQDAVKGMMNMEEEVLREKWEAMDQGPEGLQMHLPEMEAVDVDRAGKLTKRTEQEMRANVTTKAWTMGANQGMLEAAEQGRPSAKTVFQVVSQQTGIETPEEFVDKFASIESGNYALYRRVDQLIAEGRELKQSLIDMRRQKASVAKVVQGEDETRHSALTKIDRAIGSVFERLKQQREQYAATNKAASAIRTSLNRMMDMLGGGDLDPETANGNLMNYFGVFEQRFRDLMLRYITSFFEPELADAKRRTGSHGRSQGRSGRLGMAQRYLGDPSVTLAHLHKTAVTNRNQMPVVSTAAFAIGPNVPAGGMNKTLTSVSIPSVDGPKDSKQMAAFVRPWQAATAPASMEHGEENGSDAGGNSDSGAGGTSTREPLPHIDDMFGDRPVSVPVGKVRNRRASGHAPISPMVNAQSGSWNERAATAPTKPLSSTLPALGTSSASR